MNEMDFLEPLLNMVVYIVIFLVLLIAVVLIFVIYRNLKKPDDDGKVKVIEREGKDKTPLEMLQERYVKGEISEKEYRKKMIMLGGNQENDR